MCPIIVYSLALLVYQFSSRMTIRQGSTFSLASQDKWANAGTAEMLGSFQRDEVSRLSANPDDRTVHAAAGSMSHHGVSQPRADVDVPLSGVFDTILPEERRNTSAGGFDPGREGESGGDCISLKPIFTEEGKTTSGENIDGGEIGSVGAGATLATGTFEATAAGGQWLFRVDDGKDCGNLVADIFAAKNEGDTSSRGDNRVEGEDVYGKLDRVEISELTERASMTAPVPAPSLPSARTGEWLQYSDFQRQNEGASMQQATWDSKVRRDQERTSTTAAEQAGKLPAGDEIGASGRESESLVNTMANDGGEFLTDRRVLQVGRSSFPDGSTSRLQALVCVKSPGFSVWFGVDFAYR